MAGWIFISDKPGFVLSTVPGILLACGLGCQHMTMYVSFFPLLLEADGGHGVS